MEIKFTSPFLPNSLFIPKMDKQVRLAWESKASSKDFEDMVLKIRHNNIHGGKMLPLSPNTPIKTKTELDAYISKNIDPAIQKRLMIEAGKLSKIFTRGNDCQSSLYLFLVFGVLPAPNLEKRLELTSSFDYLVPWFLEEIPPFEKMGQILKSKDSYNEFVKGVIGRLKAKKEIMLLIRRDVRRVEIEKYLENTWGKSEGKNARRYLRPLNKWSPLQFTFNTFILIRDLKERQHFSFSKITDILNDLFPDEFLDVNKVKANYYRYKNRTMSVLDNS
jgi:hypothetical protein